MNSKDVREAKRVLEVAERRLVDVRTMSERLSRALPNASDDFRPSLESALAALQSSAPRLQQEFDNAFDILRSVAFVTRLDPSRIETRGADQHRGPRRYREKQRAR